jgi:uncharacterized protein (TIGR00375 family)
MIINADLHIHGRYSLATSKNMTPQVMAPQAKLKGLDIVATGDALHQKWLNLVEETTEESSDGIFSLKESARDSEEIFDDDLSKFILTTEVEDMKRVHHLIIFPSIEAANKTRKQMKGNMDSDGRPRIRMDGADILDIAHENGCIVGPSHAFTPWTSIYKEYDSIQDCYGRMPDFLELGLSADSDMADTIEELQNIPFLTNSDAHSPWPHRLGREFNELEVQKLTYEGVKDAILGKKINANYGFDPKLGKYHQTACSKCFTQYAVEDAIKMKMRCPCGGKIKKGVDYRIYELSKWEEPHHPLHRPVYIHILPLAEIISITHGKGVTTVFVQKIWKEMIDKFNDEITALIHAPMKEVYGVDSKVADVIKAFRNNTLQIKPGGGGKYGEIVLPQNNLDNYI